MSPNRPAANYLLAAEELRRNERQWTAYESRDHCVVLAGPGSGKTKVLTIKMARMLAEDVHPPHGIACITFNNQCVKELKRRLGKLGIDEGSRAFIGTVHSFCLREVVLPYAKMGGANLPYPVRVAPPGEQKHLFAEAVRAVLGNGISQQLRTHFDEFRRTVLDRNSAEWARNDQYASLVAKYERLLADAGKIDFDGMILTGLALIKANPWLRKALKAKYPILVVDEYQDLGVPLHEIVQHLCFDGGIRLFAVGDPDQSIYGFTGARPALLHELADREDIRDIRLRLNYRCGKTIIVASTAALAEIRDFESAEDHEGFVQDYQCQDGFDEQVALAVGTIVPDALKRRKGRKLGDIGILYQNQYDGEKISRAVEAAGIEYVRSDQGIPYQKTPVIFWLEDCASWCAGGWRLGEPRLSKLLLEWIRFNPRLTRDSEIMSARRDLVRFLFGTRTPHMRLLDWLNTFINLSIFAQIENDPSLTDEVEAFRSLYEASKDGKPLARYSLINFGGQRGSPDRLNLTTIHSAKGLEYDVAIMMGLEEGRLPRYNATEDNDVLKEERRKFYVAMTRARDEVHLLWSGWYMQGETNYSRGRSRFITEVIEKVGN
jgi:DNA helicase-2/ATP-dependent DNA helicase PcrA